MQSTGESAAKLSQDYDDYFSNDAKECGDDEDFISSPAMTLQNVILKCFPQPAMADIPLKHRKAQRRRQELKSLKHSMVMSENTSGM